MKSLKILQIACVTIAAFFIMSGSSMAQDYGQGQENGQGYGLGLGQLFEPGFGQGQGSGPGQEQSDNQNNNSGNSGCIGETSTNVFCIMIYEPVCGCDGVTYSNSCIATNFYGVKQYTMGPCE